MSGGGMPKINRIGWRGHGGLAAMLSLALFSAGCSSGSMSGAPSAPAAGAAPASSWGISNFFSSSSAKEPQAASGAQPELNCPPIQVRQGASTLTIAPNGDRSTMSVKYQASFLREARQCYTANGVMVLKVGVEGRVIVGPAGAPGQLDVPLRIAVVQETPGGMRAVVTKFIRIPTAIAGNPDGTIFSHIEDGLSFPLPTPTAALDDYVVYVGFDPQSAQAQDAEQAKPKPKAKAKPKPSVSAN